MLAVPGRILLVRCNLLSVLGLQGGPRHSKGRPGMIAVCVCGEVEGWHW